MTRPKRHVDLDARRRPTLSALLGIDGGRLAWVALVGAAVILRCFESVLARSPVLRPELLMLVVVYLALEHELTHALLTTLVVGYVGDVSSGDSRGLYLAAAIGVFFVVRALAFRFVGRRWYIIMLLSVAASLVHLAFLLLLERVLGPGRADLSSAGQSFAVRITCASILGYPLYFLLHAIERAFKPQQTVFLGGKRR